MALDIRVSIRDDSRGVHMGQLLVHVLCCDEQAEAMETAARNSGQ